MFSSVVELSSVELLSPLLLFHMFVMISDSTQERVHTIIISDLGSHEPLNFFYACFKSVVVRKL